MKNKLLVLTPRFPYPVIGGDRLRIYQLCKQLKKDFSLSLLSLCDSKSELDMLVEDDVFDEIHRISQPKWRSYWNCLLALPTSKPLQVAYYQNELFARKLTELAPSHDMVLAHLIRVGHYARRISIPKILEMTDAISLNYSRVKGLSKYGSVRHLIYSVEQNRLNEFERSIVRDFDVSVLVSEIDKSYLFEEASIEYSKVLVCSNGVDTDELTYRPVYPSKQIVFIGNLTTVQNLDAALWFAKNVMPVLRESNDFTFKVVGRINEKDRIKLNEYDGVYATGSVHSIQDAVKGSLAGVCCMRLGAGIQNKSLEYMAMGIPCVSTKVGFEGLQAKPGRDIFLADTVVEFVEAIRSLFESEQLFSKLAKNGRSYVETHHSWASQLSPLLHRCQEVMHRNSNSFLER